MCVVYASITTFFRRSVIHVRPCTELFVPFRRARGGDQERRYVTRIREPNAVFSIGFTFQMSVNSSPVNPNAFVEQKVVTLVRRERRSRF